MKKLTFFLLLPLFLACSTNDEDTQPEEVTGYFLTLKPECSPKGLAEAKQFEVRKNVYETVISESETGGYCEVYHEIEDIHGYPQVGYLDSYFESH